MQKLRLAGSTAIGIVIGAVVFNSLPAFADLPVIDPASILPGNRHSQRTEHHQRH